MRHPFLQRSNKTLRFLGHSSFKFSRILKNMNNNAGNLLKILLEVFKILRQIFHFILIFRLVVKRHSLIAVKSIEMFYFLLIFYALANCLLVLMVVTALTWYRVSHQNWCECHSLRYLIKVILWLLYCAIQEIHRS